MKGIAGPKVFRHRKLAILLAASVLIGMVGVASASVYVFFYAGVTATVRTSDVTLAAGTDASVSCTVYPCATVAISATSDTATVSLSMFRADSTYSPAPATYYTNLVQVRDATNAHSILAVTIFGISRTSDSDFGRIRVYYCTTQTDFNPDGTLVTPSNCVGSFSVTSLTGGAITGTFPVGISPGNPHYIEVVAYAGSSATVTDTVQFKVAIQWV